MFPCANHTRFEHSLGTYYLTSNVNFEDSDIKKDLSICALLHDIGHGAFSHVIERVTGVSHEDFVMEKSKIIFEDLDLDTYPLKYFNHPLFEVVCGDFGTDRLDYLCRDSYHIGSKYGVIEHDTIIRSIVIENDKIYFNEKYAHSLEYMLLARHYMFYAVYQHKTVRKLNCMLIEAIENVLNHFSPHELYYMDDLDLIYYFKEYEIKEWHDIETRKLWKTIGAYDSLEDIPEKYLDSSEYCIDEPLDWKPKIHTYLYPSKEKFKSKILSYLNKIYRGKYYVFKKND